MQIAFTTDEDFVTEVHIMRKHELSYERKVFQSDPPEHNIIVQKGGRIPRQFRIKGFIAVH